MSLTYHSDSSRIVWTELADVIERAPLGKRDPESVQRSFTGSYVRCFVEDEGKLIGAGRAISDGSTNSAIYDIVVLPEYQGKGIGKEIMSYLLARLPERSVLLISVPRQEGFYQKLGFHKLKTAYLRHSDIDRWVRDGYIEQTN